MTGKVDRDSKGTITSFSAKEIGAGLKEVASDFVRVEEKNVESRWFHSNKDADLFIWKDDKKNIIKFQVSFFGAIVEWNIIEGVRTGFVMEDESKHNMGSPMIRFDSTPSRHSVEQGVEIIGYVDGISGHDKLIMIENLAKNTIFEHFSVEEVIKKFRPNFESGGAWNRLLKLLGFKK